MSNTEKELPALPTAHGHIHDERGNNPLSFDHGETPFNRSLVFSTLEVWTGAQMREYALSAIAADRARQVVGEPGAWREAIQRLREGVSAGSRSLSDMETEQAIAFPLLDAVEEALEALAAPPAPLVAGAGLRVALEKLQVLDFDMRITTSEGLPPEACRIIDEALAAPVAQPAQCPQCKRTDGNMCDWCPSMRPGAEPSGYICADCKAPLRTGYTCDVCGSEEAEDATEAEQAEAPSKGLLLETCALLAPFVEGGIPIRLRDARDLLQRLRSAKAKGGA